MAPLRQVDQPAAAEAAAKATHRPWAQGAIPQYSLADTQIFIHMPMPMFRRAGTAAQETARQKAEETGWLLGGGWQGRTEHGVPRLAAI